MLINKNRQLELEEELALIESEQIGRHDIKSAQLLIARGWKETYAELFGAPFVNSLDSEETEDKHHSEAIEWHWNARIALLEGNRPPDEHFAYFPIWSRANNKSSIAERMVVVDAVLSAAYNQPGYCLYIGREKDRVKENIQNIESLLSLPKIREYAPQLSEVARNDETNQKRQWTGTFLHTKAGYVIKGGTVESTQAGSRVGETRVTLFVPDDIDSREDSSVIAETRFRLLTTEILPMKQANTLTFFAQNLISRHSVMYRIQKGLAKVLTNRKPTEPIPAVRNLVTEQRTVNGIVKDIVVSGKPTWRVWTLQRVQDEIDTYGLNAFLRECQHEVEQSKEGVILQNYDDGVHVISESEFAAVYGSSRAWESWPKWAYNDWARTKTSKHANVAGYITVSSQNTKFPGATFLLFPMSFPANTEVEDVAERLLTILSPYAFRETTWHQLIKDSLTRANSEVYTSSFRDRIEYERSCLKNVIPTFSRPLLSRFNVRGGVISHSEDTVRKIYNDVFGFGFVPANPTKTEAIEDINRSMKIDYALPHPFRPEQKGFSRWFIVAPDDKNDISPRFVNGTVVYRPVPSKESVQPHELFDWDLIRYQLKNWRWRDPVLSANGEKIDDTLKINDDFGQALQMFYMKNLIGNAPLTRQEQIEALTSEQNSAENLSAHYGQPGFVELTLARRAEQRGIEMRMEEEREREESELRQILSSRRVHLSNRRRRN